MEYSPEELQITLFNQTVNDIDEEKQKNIKSTFDFFDMEKLAQQFPIDVTFDKKKRQIVDSGGPFKSKSYSYEKSEEDLFTYFYPPKGPIPFGATCSICEQNGTKYHLTTCDFPYPDSLILNKQGAKDYLEQYPQTDKKLKDIVNQPYSDFYELDLHGEKKEFRNVIILSYESNNKRVSIRISRNGVINIIHAPPEEKDIAQQVINRINQTKALKLSQYHKVYPESTKYKFRPSISRVDAMQGRFRMFPRDEGYLIPLDKLNEVLSKKYIKDDELTYKTISKPIVDYTYTSGTGTDKNPKISFKIVIEPIKINVIIFQRGAVQLDASLCNQKDVRKGWCDTIGKSNVTERYLSIVYDLLNLILDKEIPRLLQKEELKIRGIQNMVTGPKTAPLVCHDRPNRKVRPVPFTFTGKCPEEDQILLPQGMKRPDGLYEPCCYKAVKTKKDKLYKQLYKGFPNEKEADEFNIHPGKVTGMTYIDKGKMVNDIGSAVFIPGTQTRQSRAFKGLVNLDKNQLMNCIELHRPDFFDFKPQIVTRNILNEYTNLINKTQPEFIYQHPILLRKKDINDKFTKMSFTVTSIPNKSTAALLFITRNGDSFIINEKLDVARFELDREVDLKGIGSTLLEARVEPIKNKKVNVIVYDVIYFKSQSFKRYTFDRRYTTLKDVQALLKHPNLSFALYDTNLIQGSKAFLSKRDISLKFLPLDSFYQLGINNNVLLWEHPMGQSSHITAKIKPIDNTNQWNLFVNDTQLEKPFDKVKIPVKFTREHRLIENDLVTFGFKFSNKSLNIKNPLVPLSKSITSKYSPNQVQHILEAIVNPIPQTLFTRAKNKWEIDNRQFVQSSIPGPLQLLN